MDVPGTQPLSRLLMFPPDFEREFEDEKRVERTAHFKRCGFLGLFLYDFFLLYHWQLTPDDFGLACVLSLAVFTPMMLFTIFVQTNSRSVIVRETSWTVMPIVAVSFFMLIALESSSPHRPSSFYSAILVMIFSSAVQRLRLRFALAANFGMLLVVVLSLLASNAFDLHTRLASLVFFTVALILMAMAAYAVDRESRLAYLAERQTRLLNAELQRVSRIDPLTGLWNRRYLDTVMAEAWLDVPAESNMTVILVDVDHFKRFNDAFGHAAGDACLVAVGQCLSDTVGVAATAVRYGGEEFIVFLPDCDAAFASRLAERIRSDMRERHIHAAGENVSITVSVGVATAAANVLGASDLIAAADLALYSAKARGRDCVVEGGDVAGRRPVRHAA